MTTEQWPHPWPPSEHCYVHGAHEPVPQGGAYIVCGECGHVYHTALDLLRDFAEQAPPGFVVSGDTTAKDIAFCPFCTHDF